MRSLFRVFVYLLISVLLPSLALGETYGNTSIVISSVIFNTESVEVWGTVYADISCSVVKSVNYILEQEMASLCLAVEMYSGNVIAVPET